MDRDGGTGTGRGRVVLGFDGSPRAWASLRVAELEALSRGTVLELLAVRGRAPGQHPPRPRAGRSSARPQGGASQREGGRDSDLTAGIGAARRMVMTRRPGLDVSATVLRSDDLEECRPLLGADLLILGWIGAATDLVAGLGAPGTRLVRAATVPVLVVPAGAAWRRSGPVVLLRDGDTTGRAFEVAVDECLVRKESLTVAEGVSGLEGAGLRRGAATVIVAALSRGGSHDGLQEAEAARLVNSARVPVLLVPPPPGPLPGAPRESAGRPEPEDQLS